jgi:tRNA A-37 threonylcarbamoyl transferase component Bud32
MPASVTCPNPACARRSTVADAAVGRAVRCPACGTPFPATGSRPAAAGAAAPPDTGIDLKAVGRFVVRARLGAGAFGTVYRAYDPQLDREVALKVPNPGVLDSPTRVERFLREAKAAANLRHPHVVPVYDAGRDGDRYFIASAFVDGKPLAAAIEDGGVDMDRAARLTRELAEALAYAHGEGIVHRDVKPANCMLDNADRLHLMDFGLAYRADDVSRLTTDGSVMGTPAYMAPEQAAGKTAEVGPAADQYACGVVLYELLTGKVPFEGPVPVVIHHQMHTDPAPPSKLRAGVPQDLETICRKALAKRLGDRYGSCQELAGDLRRWQEGEPITARRLSPLERLTRWGRKNKAVAGLTGALAAALVVGLAASLWLAAVAGVQASRASRSADDARAEQRRADDERQTAEQQRVLATALATEAQGNFKRSEIERKRADEERGKADAARLLAVDEQKRTAEEKKRADEAVVKLTTEERVARRNLYVARMQLARGAWTDGRLDALADTLALASPQPGTDDLRGFEWYYLKNLVSGADHLSIKSPDYPEPEIIPARRPKPLYPHVVAVSPDGRFVGAALDTSRTFRDLSNKALVVVWEATTGKEILRLAAQAADPEYGEHMRVLFAPDGR